ncbi:unnamed protein product, partial [Mesorhabditis belari]|uniref:Uncharacterized protein n=1 Tax=Mesorhabditis belari TaxID=2138241 RepID=A0AAF3FEM3_9BILA
MESVSRSDGRGLSIRNSHILKQFNQQSITRNPIFCTITLLFFLFTLQTEAHLCRIDDCSAFYSRTCDYEGVQPESTHRYCEILSTYRNCINETKRFCHSNLKFHYVEFHLKKQWKNFLCEKTLEESRNSDNRCELAEPSHLRAIRYCTLFGGAHLRKFNGEAQTMREIGARPFADNRYFLVQVTTSHSSSADGLLAVLTRISVIVKAHNCTNGVKLTYEAATDMEALPKWFVDGSSVYSANHKRKAIEVHEQDKNSVVIYLRHCDSSIHIRRHGPRLSVSVRAPENVITKQPHFESQLCITGSSRVFPLAEALTDPIAFSRCHAIREHVPLKLAANRCANSNLTDQFFDSCTFDLSITGDEYLVASAIDAQSDIRFLFPHYQYVERGRMILPEKPQEIPFLWNDCVRYFVARLNAAFSGILMEAEAA